MNRFRSIGTFALGFGAGFVIGILFAPDKGPDTRDYLTERASESPGFLFYRKSFAAESSGLAGDDPTED